MGTVKYLLCTSRPVLALSILSASNTSKSDDLTVTTLLHVPNVLHTLACQHNKHIIYTVQSTFSIYCFRILVLSFTFPDIHEKYFNFKLTDHPLQQFACDITHRPLHSVLSAIKQLNALTNFQLLTQTQ